MKNAQKEQSKKCMSDLVEEPRTNKQRLWNDIIKFLRERNCTWKNINVSSYGSSLVQALTDVLWHVDGQQDVFRKQGHSIPSTFAGFTNYNRPELSKHRKRQKGNMSGTVLKSLASHLFTCLQGVYWNRDNWKELKPDMEQLAKSIDDYAHYLQSSSKKVRFNQSSPSPVREISDHVSFQFLPANRLTPVPAKLKDLHMNLEQLPELEYVSIEQFSPTNSKERYQYLQALKSSGFPFPSALLTYAHGNNVGNLNFIWRVQSTSEESYSDCQSVIEKVKKNIPTYHTRAMRKELFTLFGRLTSSVKPAVIRHIYRSITGRLR